MSFFCKGWIDGDCGCGDEAEGGRLYAVGRARDGRVRCALVCAGLPVALGETSGGCSAGEEGGKTGAKGGVVVGLVGGGDDVVW